MQGVKSMTDPIIPRLSASDLLRASVLQIEVKDRGTHFCIERVQIVLLVLPNLLNFQKLGTFQVSHS